MNWLLIVVIAIILICCITGYKVGFLRRTFSALSIVIAIAITSFLNPIAAKYIEENDTIHGFVYGFVSDFIDKDQDGQKVVTGEQQEEYVKNLTLPDKLEKTLLNDSNIQTYKEKGISKFEDYLKATFTDIIIDIFSYLVVYIIVRLIIMLIARAVDAVSKVPGLDKVNESVGVVVGLVQSVLIIWVIFALIAILANTSVG